MKNKGFNVKGSCKLCLDRPASHCEDKKVTLQGAVYKPDPAKFGPGPYPTVVSCYGGPHVSQPQNIPLEWLATSRSVSYLIYNSKAEAVSCCVTVLGIPYWWYWHDQRLRVEGSPQSSKKFTHWWNFQPLLAQSLAHLCNSKVQFISDNWGMTADLRAQAQNLWAPFDLSVQLFGFLNDLCTVVSGKEMWPTPEMHGISWETSESYVSRLCQVCQDRFVVTLHRLLFVVP